MKITVQCDCGNTATYEGLGSPGDHVYLSQIGWSGDFTGNDDGTASFICAHCGADLELID